MGGVTNVAMITMKTTIEKLADDSSPWATANEATIRPTSPRETMPMPSRSELCG